MQKTNRIKNIRKTRFRKKDSLNYIIYKIYKNGSIYIPNLLNILEISNKTLYNYVKEINIGFTDLFVYEEIKRKNNFLIVNDLTNN